MDQRIIVSYIVSLAIMFVVPILLGLGLYRRFRVPGTLFLYGAGVYLIVEVFVRALLIQYLGDVVWDTVQSSLVLFMAWMVFDALTLALFQEGSRYLAYRFIWKDEDKGWAGALMYGAGHGGLELILTALLAFMNLMNVINVMQVDPSTLPAEDAAQLSQAVELFNQLPWGDPLLVSLMYLLMLVIQISLSVLVLQVFRRGKIGWLWLAVGYHALMEIARGQVSFYARQQPSATVFYLISGAVLLPFAAAGVWIILRLRPDRAEEVLPSPSLTSSS